LRRKYCFPCIASKNADWFQSVEQFRKSRDRKSRVIDDLLNATTCEERKRIMQANGLT